ncbi:MAG: amidase [Acidimicrobiales bacterium]
MSSFITRLDWPGTGPTLAVKDLIDLAGVPTTAGSRALAEVAAPAAVDAPCMAGARAAHARIVGKANLYELAYGASGVNDWFGTPVNPLDPALLPGGSSSGSAVAVATGEAQVAYGSDTGGSVRIPSAFCGTTGLKTTHGRIPLAGVWPLAPSLDTVGPMAADVAGVALGMALLEPGFTPAARPAATVGRIRPTGLVVDPLIDRAVDRALAGSGMSVIDIELDGWAAACRAGGVILDYEAARADGHLMTDPDRRAKLGAEVADRLTRAARVTADQVESARAEGRRWLATLRAAFTRVELLALPTVAFFPPPLAEAGPHAFTANTMPFNLAGFPALALPVPTGGRLPASLQLAGPAGGEELLVATGAVVEGATGAGGWTGG